MLKCSSRSRAADVSTRGSRDSRLPAILRPPAILLGALFLALAPSVPCAGGLEPDGEASMVAVFDGGGVTAEEFVRAYKQAAQKYAGYDMTKYKRDLLVKIATNKLLEREALERGFVDELGEWDSRIIADKEKAMINQLRRDVILKGITVTEEDVKTLYEKSKVRRLTRAISVGNKSDADRIMAELAGGADFVELAKKWSLDLGSARWKAVLAWVKAGDGPENVENLLMGLDVGETGGPIEGRDGYYILRVDSLYQKEDLPSYDEARPLLRSKALARKRTPVRAAFMDSVAKARGVTYDDDTIQMVIDRFQREGWLEDDTPGRASRIPAFTSSELNRPIFSFEGGSYPLEDYLQYLKDKKINPAYWLAGREEVERGLRRFVRAKLELLLAYEMGMDKVPSVRGQVREKAAYKGVVDMLVDVAGGDESVKTTDKDRMAFYEENKWKYTKPGAIVFSIITVMTMEVVDDLYADMKSGLPFSQVADDYRWVLNEDFTAERMRLTAEDAEDNPKIFDTARRMKVGAVSEPIPLDRDVGIAVIKLLEREPLEVIPYEEAKEEVRVDLNLQLLNTANQKIEDFKQSVRDKHHFRVVEEVLESIEL